jgi:hypothetical protein
LLGLLALQSLFIEIFLRLPGIMNRIIAFPLNQMKWAVRTAGPKVIIFLEKQGDEFFKGI